MAPLLRKRKERKTLEVIITRDLRIEAMLTSGQTTIDLKRNKSVSVRHQKVLAKEKIKESSKSLEKQEPERSRSRSQKEEKLEEQVDKMTPKANPKIGKKVRRKISFNFDDESDEEDPEKENSINAIIEFLDKDLEDSPKKDRRHPEEILANHQGSDIQPEQLQITQKNDEGTEVSLPDQTQIAEIGEDEDREEGSGNDFQLDDLIENNSDDDEVEIVNTSVPGEDENIENCGNFENLYSKLFWYDLRVADQDVWLDRYDEDGERIWPNFSAEIVTSPASSTFRTESPIDDSAFEENSTLSPELPIQCRDVSQVSVDLNVDPEFGKGPMQVSSKSTFLIAYFL